MIQANGSPLLGPQSSSNVVDRRDLLVFVWGVIRHIALHPPDTVLLPCEQGEATLQAAPDVQATALPHVLKPLQGLGIGQCRLGLRNGTAPYSGEDKLMPDFGVSGEGLCFFGTTPARSIAA